MQREVQVKGAVSETAAAAAIVSSEAGGLPHGEVVAEGGGARGGRGFVHGVKKGCFDSGSARQQLQLTCSNFW